MSALNQLYLSELSKQYEIESIEMFESDFSSYRVSLNKRGTIYLILCNNYGYSFDINTVLDKISLFDGAFKMGNSYLCVMSIENPAKDMCFYCNGKSFAHFIFLDRQTKRLVYDKNFYYSDSKRIKQLIDIYQDCFDNFVQSSGEE